MTFEEIEKNETIRAYISKADESLVALGYTEHSFAHVTHVAAMAGYLLETLGYDAHTVELAKIAGYLHDIGNLVNRIEHSQSGAVMAFQILTSLGFGAEDVATIVTAIGNHDVRHPRPCELLRKKVHAEDQRGPHARQAEADGRHALRLRHGLF